MSDEVDSEKWYELRTSLMAEHLGDMHDKVMHAVIPYAIGGALDLYYFPDSPHGTAITTLEVSEEEGNGASNKAYKNYELVMFTRHKLDLDVVRDHQTDFGRAHSSIRSILNAIARYAAEAELNACETCEFPPEFETLGGRCLIFDNFAPPAGWFRARFGLLVVIEVFRSEMLYARDHGGKKLIERLKAAGHYPCSDLDRDPVA